MKTVRSAGREENYLSQSTDTQTTIFHSKNGFNELKLWGELNTVNNVVAGFKRKAVLLSQQIEYVDGGARKRTKTAVPKLSRQ